MLRSGQITVTDEVHQISTTSLTQFHINPYRDTNEPHTILFYFITDFGIVTFVLAVTLSWLLTLLGQRNVYVEYFGWTTKLM